MLNCGARFLGDDLAVLCPPDGEDGFRVSRGRPAMRLHPATAALIDTVSCEQVLDDERDKLLVWPANRANDAEYPLAGIFLLGPGPCEVPIEEALQLLSMHIFRPRWMRSMPGHGKRLAWIIELLSEVPIRRLAAVECFDDKSRRKRTQAALSAMAV
jgi:hypothetical protein